MNRLLIALPLAALVAFSLFSFMAWMVDDGHSKRPEASTPVQFNLVMIEEDTHVETRQRSLPKPPQPQTPPAAQPMTPSIPMVGGGAAGANQLAPSTTPITAGITAGISSSIDGIAINAPALGNALGSSIGSNQQAMPLYRVEPRYPSMALKRKIQGHIVLKFNIDEQGRPTDIKVIEAKPKYLFNRDAIQALRKWKYQPKLVDGKAVVQIGRTQRIDFKLSK
ncbi:energy transducer TonB [Vibrio profundum]|uniref:energy transducer TonB n=1 Tax=Vibrio profundum TaxID=2910247 RepID=UPI003D1405A2